MIEGAKLSQELIIEIVEDGQKVGAQAPGSSHMLCERMTFNQLYGYSERKRKDRSQNVKGPSLKLEAFKGGERAWFSFSSLERTEGRRHKGYIQFFPPRRAKTPLERLECAVDCTCKDFRYRWAWAVKQRGSSVVGPNSFNKAWNRAPRITNRSARPGICKHLLALKRYIQGLYTNFESEKPNDGRYLDRMIRAANRQVISSDTGKPVSPSDQWTSAARGQATAKPAQPPKLVPKKAAPAPLPTPTMIKPGQVDPRRRRRESLDHVVMGMTPSAPEIKRLLQEVEELEAEIQQDQKTPPPAPGPEAPPELAPGEDLVSLVRSIRDMIAKLVGGEELSPPSALEATKKEEPAIPADAQKLSN